MSRTRKAQKTWRGMDKCPPRWFRNQNVTRPLRRKSKLFALRVLRDEADGLPAPRKHLPWFT